MHLGVDRRNICAYALTIEREHTAMNLQNQRPIFVPQEYWREIEKSLSKAALMDLAWDFATTHSETDSPEDIIRTLRERANIVLGHRAASKAVS